MVDVHSMIAMAYPWPRACRAATAASLYRQKPMAVADSRGGRAAWWRRRRCRRGARRPRRRRTSPRRPSATPPRRCPATSRCRNRAGSRPGSGWRAGSPRRSRADGPASAPRSRRAARRRAREAGTFRLRAPGRRRAIAAAVRDGLRPCRARSTPDASRATSSTDGPLPDGRFVAAEASPEPPPMSTIVDAAVRAFMASAARSRRPSP